jgi:c-di-GMP-binding flagellar brake protein YcgR
MQVRLPPKNPMEGNIQDQEDNYIVRGELADISLDGAAIYLPKGIFSVEQFHKGALVTFTLSLPGEFYPGLPAASEPQLDDSSDDPFTRETLRVAAASGRELKPVEPPPAGANLQRITDPDLSIEAEVANLHLEELRARYRIGLRFLPGEAAQGLINQFIVQRQAEIVREIKMMYALLADIADK